MTDQTDYINLLSKRRVRDINEKGSLTRVNMTDRQTIESLFPFFDTIPSPVEFEAILARTTPFIPVEDLVITVTAMEVEENIATE